MTTSPPSPRTPSEPVLDVLLSGTVFFDLVFTGFAHAPSPGTEVFTEGMGSAPGGIANLAVAAARLGLRTGLVAGFGDDLYADWLWRTLADQEHVDLSCSRRYEFWHTPVTVSLAREGDRSLITHGHPLPEALGDLVTPPPTRAVMVDIGDVAAREQAWWRRSAAEGALVFADAGWDPEGTWGGGVLEALQGCHAFTPNAVEAMAYTRASTPEAALCALADVVPLAVVTRGADGAIAVDQSTGEHASAPALHVDAIDTTGAGDTFAAALLLGTLRGWPLAERLAFASLCSALAVQHFGGSLAAPGWGDISDWWSTTTSAARHGDAEARATARQYGFLAEHLPLDARRVRRAEATIARLADLGGDGDAAAPVLGGGEPGA